LVVFIINYRITRESENKKNWIKCKYTVFDTNIDDMVKYKEVFVLRVISCMIGKTLLDNNQQHSFPDSCSKIIKGYNIIKLKF